MTALMKSLLCSSAAIALAFSVTSASADEADVTPDRLLNADAEPQNWLMTHQNYSAHRYSRLDQINRDNVADLKVAYIVGIAPHGAYAQVDMQGTPLVDDGMIYVADGWNRLYKIDGRSGDNGPIVWFSDPESLTEGSSPRGRGPALWGDLVITNLRDGRVIGTDRDTGEIVWDEQVGGLSVMEIQEQFTAAPLAADNHIIVGQSRGDGGTRGWLAGLDPETGEEQWRWYSIPEPGEPGAETWLDESQTAWMTGGGSFWTTGSYDPVQRVTIWGSANPVPMFDPEYRPGDNLFTNSALAVSIDTGELAWYFQYTPNESWDFDEQGVHMLYDLEIDGVERQVVGHFSRSGFYYQLDRSNGAFIDAGQFVNVVNWTAGIDEKTGLPIEYDPNLAVQVYIPASRALRGEEANLVCPTHVGGVRFQPPAFNPDTGIAYSVGAEGCSSIEVLGNSEPGPGVGPGTGGRRTIPEYFGAMRSVDVATNEVVASVEFPFDLRSGVLATAGGLVFIGQHDGWISAHDADTLETLWRFNLGTELKAPPMTFSYGGKQYIAITTGGSPYNDNPPGLENQKHTPMLAVFSL